MKYIKLFENFLNESAYSERKTALSIKQTTLSNKRKELTKKISELNQKPRTPKIALQIQIANLKIAASDLELKKLKLDFSILDLSNKMSNL